MNIEIVTTLNANLKETGFGVLKSCKNVLKSLRKMGHTTRLNICTSQIELNEIVSRKPDLVILAVKYLVIDDQEKLWLSEFFSHHKINYSGSTREALILDSNKVLAKQFLRANGIRTANYFTALPGQFKNVKNLPLPFPLFLKPIDAANGNGVDDFSFVNNFLEYEEKVRSLYEIYKLPILVEEYLDGREFTVSIIKAEPSETYLSAIEIIPLPSSNGIRILGSKAKSDNSEEIKKISDFSLTRKVKDLAIDAFEELGARDFGRIDVKTNKSGDCFFMEANLVPGMTEGSSYFPLAYEIDLGLSYDQVIKLIIKPGFDRVSPSSIHMTKPQIR